MYKSSSEYLVIDITVEGFRLSKVTQKGGEIVHIVTMVYSLATHTHPTPENN